MSHIKGTEGYKDLQGIDIEYFVNALDTNRVITDKEKREDYSRDYTEDLSFMPSVVLICDTVEEISQVLKYCNSQKIPVTVRGAGTGLSGGALPIFGGVVLSMEKFNHITEIDEANLQATVEPGVITQVFQEACRIASLNL